MSADDPIVRDPKDTCPVCVFCDAQSRCRYDSPQMLESSGTMACWPVVSSRDWCSKFSPNYELLAPEA